MSTFTIENLEAIDRLKARFLRLVNPDATPLMVTWMRIIDDDNRRGVLAGLDKDGVPMTPVTYRPKKPIALSPTQRLKQRKSARKGQFAGFGLWASGLHNNLTTSEYLRLDGPPLAPRRQFSRVITNLQTGYGRDGSTWYALARWDQVVSPKGVPFLKYHFDGIKQPRRDLRGVRPEGMQKARTAARNWMIDQVRSSED